VTPWLTFENGREVRHHNEPATDVWKRLKTDLLSRLPIEGLL
jgi:hypothetical protein